MTPIEGTSAAASTDWLVPPDEQQGLRRYVTTLRERIWLIIAITALTTIASIAYVALATKTYEATSTLLIIPVSDPSLEGLGLIGTSSDPTRDVSTASQLVTTTAVAERVKEETGYEGEATGLLDLVEAEPVAQSNIVAVTAKDPDPVQAAEYANAFAEQAVNNRTDQLHRQIKQQLPGLENAQEQNPTEENAAQIAEYQRLLAGDDPTFRVETTADVPTSPVSPKPLLSVVAGLLAGLILGVTAAFAFQVLDPRLRREEQLRHLFRIPIIGRVPKESRNSSDRALNPAGLSPATAEAFRTLRGTVTASRRAATGNVLLVTGSSPSEGKTSTAINLAASLSATGRQVILIEADLRRPAIGRSLGLAPERGVVGVLIESSTLQDALVSGERLGLPNLKFLLAENEGTWFSELFSLPTAAKLLDDARRLADYVIIDSPPLTDVVDALPLARSVDDVLIVVRTGTTRLNKLNQLGELLAENGIRPLGFAVVGAPRQGTESAYYFEQRDAGGPRAQATAAAAPQQSQAPAAPDGYHASQEYVPGEPQGYPPS